MTWIAEAGDGSLRDSQSIFDQAISFAGTDIGDADVEALLGDGRPAIPLRSLPCQSWAATQAPASRSSTRPSMPGPTSRSSTRGCLPTSATCCSSRSLREKGTFWSCRITRSAELTRQAAPVSRETLQRLLDVLMAGEEEMRKSLNPRLVLEFTAVKMAWQEPLIPVDEILLRMEGIEKRLGQQAPAELSSPEKTYPPPPERTLLDEGTNEPVVREPAPQGAEERWERFQAVREKKKPAASGRRSNRGNSSRSAAGC
ncbi:MAG: hypothetical protein MZW92_17160 [Comamonadaceae bacterium]|nr:hypothetical protein [Comamonadaceae bacterium]